MLVKYHIKFVLQFKYSPDFHITNFKSNTHTAIKIISKGNTLLMHTFKNKSRQLPAKKFNLKFHLNVSFSCWAKVVKKLHYQMPGELIDEIGPQIIKML